ncbi:MAG TPA: WD40 repeat domain-containing protein [Candidatus Babeliales bacterium]|nr:WD40 repeat domain-containing protein [Candidatus Babeliales bacterium]
MRAFSVFMLFCFAFANLHGALHKSPPTLVECILRKLISYQLKEANELTQKEQMVIENLNKLLPELTEKKDKIIADYSLPTKKYSIPALISVSSDHQIGITQNSRIDFISASQWHKKKDTNFALSPSNNFLSFIRQGTKSFKIFIFDIKTKHTRRLPFQLDKKTAALTPLFLSDDTFLMYAPKKNNIDIFKLDSLEKRFFVTDFPIEIMASSACTKQLLIATNCDQDNRIERCIDVITFANDLVIRHVSLVGFHGKIYSLTPSKNSSLLASATNDEHTGRVTIWDTKENQFVCSLKHNAPVHSAAFSPDNKLLLTGSRENGGKIRVWNIAKQESIANIVTGPFKQNAPPMLLSWNQDSIIIQDLWNVAYKLDIPHKRFEKLLCLQGDVTAAKSQNDTENAQ